MKSTSPPHISLSLGDWQAKLQSEELWVPEVAGMDAEQPQNLTVRWFWKG